MGLTYGGSLKIADSYGEAALRCVAVHVCGFEDLICCTDGEEA